MKVFQITQNDANQRLDKFLKKLLPHASLALIYKLNRKNCVKINGRRQDNEYRLEVEDEIKLFVNDVDYAELTKVISVEKAQKHATLDPADIVYEDKELLIINKAPGILVHPGDFKTKELSLIALVHDYLGDKLNSLTFKPSLVHRIDKDTSGIVLIAKTKNVLDFMLGELQHGKIEKYYLAVCQGIFSAPRGTIKEKLERIENAKNENKVQISALGQSAVTHYRVLYANKEQNWSVVECQIETGRMHQIRVHMNHLGHPIIGDDTYGDKKENAFLRRTKGLSRQLLHAYKVSFMHPTKKVLVTFLARLKPDMIAFLGEAPVQEWYKK